jgi:hypothetical protein
MELERQILLWSEEPWRKAARLPWKGRESGERRKTGMVVATVQALKMAFLYAFIICIIENNLIDRLQLLNYRKIEFTFTFMLKFPCFFFVHFLLVLISLRL